MYWQTLRPLQNLNSILAYCKTELRVSRITSPNKNLACEKAIVILALQDARSSIHRKYETSRGEVYRGSVTIISARTLTDLSPARVAQGLSLFHGWREARAQALIMRPARGPTRTIIAFSPWPRDNMIVLKLYSPLKTSSV